MHVLRAAAASACAIFLSAASAAQGCVTPPDRARQLETLQFRLDSIFEEAFDESFSRHPLATLVVLTSGGSAAAWAGSLIEEDEMQEYQWVLITGALLGFGWCNADEINNEACSRVTEIFGRAGVEAAMVQGRIDRLNARPLCRY